MRLSDAHRAVESGWLALMGAMLAMVFVAILMICFSVKTEKRLPYPVR